MAGGLSIEGLSQIQEIGPNIQRSRTQREFVQPSIDKSSAIKLPEGSFAQMIEKSIEKVNQLQINADHSIKNLIAGRTKNIHGTVLDLERADLSLKLMMQVRNKIMDAYKEIIRMQI